MIENFCLFDREGVWLREKFLPVWNSEKFCQEHCTALFAGRVKECGDVVFSSETPFAVPHWGPPNFSRTHNLYIPHPRIEPTESFIRETETHRFYHEIFQTGLTVETNGEIQRNAVFSFRNSNRTELTPLGEKVENLKKTLHEQDPHWRDDDRWMIEFLQNHNIISKRESHVSKKFPRSFLQP